MRRLAVALVSLALLTTPLAAEAQQAGRVYRIGLLLSAPRANLHEAAWRALAGAWDLRGDLTDEAALALVGQLFRSAMAILHATLGALRRDGGATVAERDLVVTASYYGAAKGDYRPRAHAEREPALRQWGPATGDLYINPEICFANVPQSVWRFELGGYPVLKKWLGYRQASRREGRPLTLAEANHFRSMVQRLAALLAFQPELDALYETVAANA